MIKSSKVCKERETEKSYFLLLSFLPVFPPTPFIGILFILPVFLFANIDECIFYFGDFFHHLDKDLPLFLIAE